LGAKRKKKKSENIGKKEEEKIRKYCKECGWVYYPHVAQAAAGVVLKKDKILLVQRRREPFVGGWMFPAGFVDYGEHPLKTMVREVKEETNLRVKAVSLLDVCQDTKDPRSPGHLVFFYSTKIIRGKLENGDRSENSDLGWFKLSKLPWVAWPGHKLILQRLKRGEFKNSF